MKTAWVERAKADSTPRSSQAVPHPSTNRALSRLTSEVGRDLVHSTRYGRQREALVPTAFGIVLAFSQNIWFGPWTPRKTSEVSASTASDG